MRPARVPVVLVLALGLLASRASLSPAWAQERPCPVGRVRAAATQGRCCWPGQSWSSQFARCEGPPTCPAGFEEQGDACVSSRAAPVEPTAPPIASAAPPVPTLAVPPPPVTSAAPPVAAALFVGRLPDGTYRYGVLPEPGVPMASASASTPASASASASASVTAQPTVPPPPAPSPPVEVRTPYTGGPVPPGARVEARLNLGLVISGPILFAVGYGYGCIVGIGSVEAPAVGAIPLVGPLIAVELERARADREYAARRITRNDLEYRYSSYYAGLAIAAIPPLILQAAGLSLTIAGAVVRRRELVTMVPSPRAARPWHERLAVAPMTSPTFSGLAVLGSF